VVSSAATQQDKEHFVLPHTFDVKDFFHRGILYSDSFNALRLVDYALTRGFLPSSSSGRGTIAKPGQVTIRVLL
jgi:hypothetical protein